MRSITFCAMVLMAGVCSATSLKELSFEDLVASSPQIVAGHVTRSWASWGSQHKFIWTRYEVAIDDVVRGPKTSTIIVSEPGGVLDGERMRVESAVRYEAGEHVALFLHQFPSGEIRTVGWGQGKFTIDGAMRVHSSSGAGFAGAGFATNGPKGTPIGSLDGVPYKELRQRVTLLAARSVAR